MQAVSFFNLWTPRVPLNTDIVPIEKLAAPTSVRLFTHQDDAHLSVRDAVRTGERLAADLVSPVTGKIASVEPFRDGDGGEMRSVVIDVAEKEEMVDGLQPVPDIADVERADLLSALSDLGFDVPGDEDIDLAVLSCLDLDPVETINQQTFREDPEAVCGAVALLQAVTGAARTAMVVTEALLRHARKHVPEGTELVALKAVYPNGLPPVLLSRLPKRLGKIKKGFVIGAERLLAMAAALKSGKPRQDKGLTLYVPAMGLCKNLTARIGTPIAHVLNAFDITLGPNAKLLLGGAMRGRPCYATDFAVAPDTNSIYVQDESRVVQYESNPCLNCGKCSAVCPMGLQVNLICRYAEYGLFEECRALRVEDCIDCGLCAYSCMARRPLIHYIKLAKARAAEAPEPEEVAT